jgi:hypothetical protein
MSDNILHCEELGSDLSFEEFFRNMVEVLCGKRDPLFRYERELRLCQLKIWLLKDDPDFKSVQGATLIFAAALISRRMVVLRKKNLEGLPSAILLRILKNSAYRNLFDFGFIAPRTLYSLALNLSFHDINEMAHTDADKRRCLNELTQWRLRLAKTDGFKAGVKAGIDAYEAARSVAMEADLILPTKKNRAHQPYKDS